MRYIGTSTDKSDRIVLVTEPVGEKSLSTILEELDDKGDVASDAVLLATALQVRWQNHEQDSENQGSRFSKGDGCPPTEKSACRQFLGANLQTLSLWSSCGHVGRWQKAWQHSQGRE